MMLLLLALTAFAQDICAVGCAHPTVQSAVDSVPVGGAGVFIVGAGYHSGPVVIDEGRRITLLALSAEPVALTADPGTGSAVVTVVGGSTLNLTAIAIDAHGLRAIDASEGSLVKLTVAVMIGGGLVGEGALIRVRDGRLEGLGLVLLGGLASGDGGQILAIDSDVDLESATFFDGSGFSGGCLAARATGARKTVSIRASGVDGARGLDKGGAFAFQGDLDVELDSLVLRNAFAVYGGAIAVVGSGARVQATDIVANETSAVYRGGFLYQDGGEVTVTSLVLETALAENGGAVALDSGSLTLDTGVISNLVVQGRGGGIYATGGSLSMVDTIVTHGSALVEGGGVWLGPQVSVPTFTRNSLCNNESPLGAGLMVRMTEPLEVRNGRFLDNIAYVDGGAVYHEGPGALTLRASNLLANRSATGGASGVTTNGRFALSDSIVAFHQGGVAIRRISDAPVAYSGGTSWWENSQGDADDLFPTTPGAVFADPQMYRYKPGDDCLGAQDYIGWYGPLRDAGAEDRTDPDGTRADVGAFGGPDGLLVLWTTDQDGDGASMIYDCDESDPNTLPGAPDDPYDGRDANCDGADDFDADGDGVRPPEHGGLDCDDTRADVYPGAEELAQDPPVDMNCDGRFDADGDGFEPPEDCDDGNADAYPGAVDADPRRDLDCDGFVDGPQITRPISCDHGGGSVGGLWALIALLTARVRRTAGFRTRDSGA